MNCEGCEYMRIHRQAPFSHALLYHCYMFEERPEGNFCGQEKLSLTKPTPKINLLDMDVAKKSLNHARAMGWEIDESERGIFVKYNGLDWRPLCPYEGDQEGLAQAMAIILENGKAKPFNVFNMFNSAWWMTLNPTQENLLDEILRQQGHDA